MFLKYLPLILLAITLDAIDIILTLIALATSPTVVITIITILINIIQAIFVAIFYLILFIYGLGDKFRSGKFLIRRIGVMVISFIGEVIPIINDIIGILPLNTISVIFIMLDEAGVIEKITTKISSISFFTPLLSKKFKLLKLPILSWPIIINLSSQVLSSMLSKVISPSNNNQNNQIQKLEPTIKSPKKSLLVSFIFLFLIFPFLTLAQTNKVIFVPYFQNENLILSAVFINPKTKTLIDYPQKSYYIWEISGMKKGYIETINQFLVTKMESYFNLSKINIKLTVVLPNLKKEVYKGEIELLKPDVAIVKKIKNYFELPFLGNYSPNEILIAKPFNFSSKNLSFIWNLNDIFLSNSSSINSSLLRTGYLILRVKNFDNIFESASEFLIVK